MRPGVDSRVRVVSQFLVGSAAENAQHSRKSGCLVVHWIQDAVFFGHNFTHSLSRVQKWHVARLAPAQNSDKSRGKVSERAGQLLGGLEAGMEPGLGTWRSAA